MGTLWKDALLKPPPPGNLQAAIRYTCDELLRVQTCFEMESDPDMIEAYIYETQALRARYRYLLKIARSEQHFAAWSPPFSGRDAG